MPNWCENELSVSGPAEELNKFREFADPLSAEKFIPIPQEFKDIESWGCFSKCKTPDNPNGHPGGDFIINPESEKMIEVSVGGVSVPLSDKEKDKLIKNYGASNSNDWARINWGTKWNFRDCEVKELIDMAIYRFNTADGPPTPVIEKMAEMYPTLSFLFTYGGIEVQCRGSILFKNGYSLIWKVVGWDGSLYAVPEPCNFSDNFTISLHKEFPDFVPDPERAANQ